MFFFPGQDRQGQTPGFGDVSSAMKAWGELMARPWPYGFGVPDAKSPTPANAMIEAIVTAQQNALQLWLTAFGVSVEDLGKPTRVPLMALPKPEPKAMPVKEVEAVATPEAPAKKVTVVLSPESAKPQTDTKIEVKAAPAKAPATKAEPKLAAKPAPKAELKVEPAPPVKVAPKGAPALVATIETVVAPPVAKAEPMPVAAPPAPKPAVKAKPAPAPEPQIDPAGLFDDNAVTKMQPKVLITPEGTADDLIKIKGIGPKLQKLLNDVGIWHYSQIARWTPGEIAWINAKIDFKGRVQRERWVAQARDLAGKG